MAASKLCYSEMKDLKEDVEDTWFAPKHSTEKRSTEEQIKNLRIMFESVEDLLKSPDYDDDLKVELSTACPNYLNVFLTAKRDLLSNDCGIVVTGGVSAGKSTLINQLIGKKLCSSGNCATTGKIIRIRDSEGMAIKCYTEEDILKTEENEQDFKQMKSILKRLTDIEKITPDLQDINYVDVHLPVPILKGNVIIVDTPGIGDDKKLEQIVLDFLPHAVSFVFVANANDAGGIHEDKLLKILKTIMDNREKMPCFDPADAMFLTNKWEAVDESDTSSDEDENEEKCEIKNQNTRTWKTIINKLRHNWVWFDIKNVFSVSLKQVKKGEQTDFTDEYNRFMKVLEATIERNKNKRVEFYYRFLKDFIYNAERGVLTRLNMLKRSDEEQQQIINRNIAEIHELQNQCKKASEELVKYKTEIIAMLAEKLYTYLHSDGGREEILNPPGKKKISKVAVIFLPHEVPLRFQNGLTKWCKGQEVETIIEDADEKIKSFATDIESKLHNIVIDMTGADESSSFSFNGATIVLGILLLPLTLVLAIVVAVVFLPIGLIFSAVLGSEHRLKIANSFYDQCLKQFSMSDLREGFEKSFGVEYGKAIERVFDESLPNVIESLFTTNVSLLGKHQDLKQKEELLKRLEKKIQKIQIATDKFESKY